MQDTKDQTEKKRGFLLSIRGFLRRLLTVVILVSILFGWSAFNYASFFSGAGVLFLGLSVHFYSKGCLTRNTTITMFGPYRFVRHPFYLGNLLIDTGLCIMSNNPFIFLGYFALFLLGYGATMRHEERRLTEIHGDRYRDYARRVPRLFPVRFPAKADSDANAYFSFERILKEHELARSLRIVVYPILLWVVYELKHDWTLMNLRGFFYDDACMNLLLLSLFIAAGIVARYQDLVSTRLQNMDTERLYRVGMVSRWMLFAVLIVVILFVPLPVAGQHIGWFIAGLPLVLFGLSLKVFGEISGRGLKHLVFNPIFLGDDIALSGLALSSSLYWIIPVAVAIFLVSSGFVVLHRKRAGVAESAELARSGRFLRILLSVILYGGIVAFLFFKMGVSSLGFLGQLLV